MTTEPDFGILLSRIYRDFETHLWQALADGGFTDVGPRHGAVLAHLRPEGVRATTVAQASGLHKQIIGTVVDELERAGYITRQPDPDDRRAKRIVPTERGLAEIAAARSAITAYEHRVRTVLGARRYGDFTVALRDLAEADPV